MKRLKSFINRNGHHSRTPASNPWFDPQAVARAMRRLRFGVWTLLLLVPAVAGVAQSRMLTLVPGWNAIAHQFSVPDRRLGTLIPNPPDATLAAFWNGSNYALFSFDLDLGGWQPNGDSLLVPGGGALIFNPLGAPFVLAFTGAPSVPVLPLNLPAGQLRLVSRQTNAPASYEEIVGLPPAEGTRLYRLRPGAFGNSIATNNYEFFSFSNSVWLPSPPALAAGESAFIQVAVGSTNSPSPQFCADFNNGLTPPGTALFGNASIAPDGSGSNVLHLTDPQPGVFGAFVISTPFGGTNVRQWTAQWRSLIGAGSGGDGYSFNWGTDLPQPPAYSPYEEGAGTGLSVTVDTFDNGGGEGPGIEIKWGGTRIAFASVPVNDSPLSLRNNQFVNATASVTASGQATFTYGMTSISAPLPGFNGMTGGSFMFAARTGATTDRHWIDDLCLMSSVDPGTNQQYQVDASAGPNGSVMPAGQAVVDAGENLTFVAMPDIGYEVESWLLDNIPQPLPANPVMFALNNIQANHAVVVNFKQAQKLDPAFPRPPDIDKLAWRDATGKVWPWIVGLHANFGPPVYDSDFANMARPLLQAGIPCHFAFGTCFGGGMLQDLEAIGRGGVIRFSGSSAVPWFDAAHYPGNRPKDWVDTYLDAMVAGNRALLTSVLAWKNNPWNTHEFSQYRDSSPLVGGLKGPGPVGDMFDHAAGVRKMAILWTGKAEFTDPAKGPPVDGPQIVRAWTKLVGFGYAAADIQVLYDNGVAPAGAPAGMVVAPAVNIPGIQPNLRNAFQRVIDASQTTNVHLFFLANDHGVLRNDCFPPGAWLIVPKIGTNYPTSRTNHWQLPAGTNVMRGALNFGPDPFDPTNGWATDPFYVSAPTIIEQPRDVVANPGDTITFSVVADGTAPIFYQWYCGTNVLPGRTNASMTITNIQTTNMGIYFVICSNACNYVSSYPANVTRFGLDWGDCPDPTYPTVLPNGARHVIVPGFQLGLIVDPEGNGQPNGAATGDDIAGAPDEDGVTLPAALVAGGNALIRVVASAAGKLDAWIDFNGNGSWADAGEQIANALPLKAGLNLLNIPVPPNAMPVSGTYARFRFSSAGGLAFTGQADDGEVEDYRVAIRPPQFADLSLTKRISAQSMEVGAELTYTLVVSNAGPDAAGSPALIDPLPPGLLLSSVSASRGACAIEDGTVLCDLGPLSSHDLATITISGTITTVGALTNQAFVTASEIDSQTGNNSASALAFVTNPPPVLDISVGGGVFQICWPAYAPYVLESTPSLRPPVIWSRDPSPSIVIGGTRCVTIVPATGNRFFRLRLRSATNEPPTALHDAYSGPHDQPLAAVAPGVLANDSDPDADTMTATVMAPPQHGSLVLSPDGAFFYVPQAGFAGVDSWTYVVSDGTQVSPPATVTMTITNPGPRVMDDQFSLQMEVAGGVATPGVLRNDSDPDGDPLLAVLETPPAHGTLEFHPDGSFQYLPNPGFAGADLFTYRASDGRSTSSLARVTLNIHAANQPPVAASHSFSLAHAQLLEVPAPGVLTGASDVDGDLLTALLETTTTNGTLVLEPDGSFAYQPAEGSTGMDSFTYRVHDGAASSGAALVTLMVTNGGAAGLADTYYVKPGQVLSNDAPGVLGNDADPELDSLVAQLVNGPGFGTLTFNADGSFVYRPNAGFTGTDSFRYTASDGVNVSPPILVTLLVTNRPPVVAADSYGVCFGRVLKAMEPGVLLNDSDAEGDALTAILVSPTAHGTVALAANGSFVYTPAAGYVGPDSFSYRASDGPNSSPAVVVSISVLTTCGVPGAVLDSYTTAPNTPLVADVYTGLLANDDDPQSCALSVQLVSGVSHGTLALEANGSFTYTPSPGYLGNDTFTYRVFNGAFYSDPAVVTIQVVGSVPISVPDDYSVHGTNVLSVGAPGVLENDVDQDDGAVLTAVLVSGPSHGTLTLEPWGSFIYTPTNRFLGVDGFTYRATDGVVTSDVAMVMIVVTNQVPLAGDDEKTTVMNTPLSVASPGVLENDTDDDGDPLTVMLVSNPVHAVAFDLQPDGSFTYTPANGYVGTDPFWYVTTDGFTSSAPAQVVITVTETPLAPNGFLPAGAGPPPELGLQAIGLFGGVPLLADSIRMPGPFGGRVPLQGVAPQWLDNGDGVINAFAGERSYPYSYPRGAAFKGRVVLRTPNRNAFRGANGQYLPVFIRGRVFCNGGPCFCNGAPCNVTVSPIRPFGMTPDRVGVGGTVYVDVQANVAFGSVDTIRLGIVWEFSINGGPWRRCAPPGTLPNSPAGTSFHNIFVTWGVPTTSSMFETVVAYGSLRGRGVNNPNALAGRIWSNFAFKQARRLDGTPLTYYKNWNVPTIGGVPDLLWFSDGRCGQWAFFFINTLQAQGLVPANMRPTSAFAIGGRQVCSPGAIFLVSKWNFRPPPGAADFPFPPWIALDKKHDSTRFADGTTAFENIMQFNAQDVFTPQTAAPVGLDWQYRWFGQPQADYVGGAGQNMGQNNPTPRSMFTDHAIVRLGNLFFDPSYGTVYGSAQHMQNTAIDGVASWNWVRDDVTDLSKGPPGRKGKWTYRVLFIKRTLPGDRPLIYFCTQ